MIIEIVIHLYMKNLERTCIALVSISLLILIYGCGTNDWTTRYSGKYDPKGNTTTIVEGHGKIVLNLDKEGESFIGPCGFNRKLLASYEFDLTPIKKEYKNDEIKMEMKQDFLDTVTVNIIFPNFKYVQIKPITGSISLNDDFSEATVNIKVLDSNKQFIDFAGNGVHKIEK